jgi:hypothetical protein
VGDGYFWVLHPNPDNDQQYSTGISDEAGKVNINKPALANTQLEALPGMTSTMADSILSWTGQTAGSDAAGSDYYESLPEPYEMKTGPFESVDELLLIKDITPAALWGQDLNHDGVVTDAERQAATVASSSSGNAISNAFSSVNNGSSSGMSSLFNNTSRGFFNDVTVYSYEPVTTRVNVNVAGNANRLQTILTTAFGASQAGSYMGKWQQRVSPRPGRPPGRFNGFGDLANQLGMQPADFGKIADKLLMANAPGAKLYGQVNLNTASKEVLLAMGADANIQQADVDTIISAQESNANSGTTSVAWAYTSLPAAQAYAITPFITGQSFQYSADIVAVGKDGRSFKRARIVVDASTTPSTIVYRKDLTSLGWPLPTEIRKAMRSGQTPPTGIMSSTLGNALGGTLK